MNPLTLVIIRHGHTALNSSGTSQDAIRGWADIPLSPEGIHDAELMAQQLKNCHFDCIYTSDLSRALDTCEIIAHEQNCPFEVVRWLRPWDLGEYTGMVSAEAFPIMLDFIKNKPDESVPGGESFNSFKERTLAGIERMVKENVGKNIAIVTHHRDERLLDAWIKMNCNRDHKIDTETFIQYGLDAGCWTDMTIQL